MQRAIVVALFRDAAGEDVTEYRIAMEDECLVTIQ